MRNASYGFDTILVKLITHPAYGDQLKYDEVVPIQKLVTAIARLANGSYAFAQTTREEDQLLIKRATYSTYEEQRFLVQEILQILDQSKLTGFLEKVKRRREEGAILFRPYIHFWVASNRWVAIKLEASFNRVEMEQMMQQPMPSSTDDSFDFSRWWFATYNNNDLIWQTVNLDQVDIYGSDGSLRRDGFEFSPIQWLWPHVAWEMTGHMRAYATLLELTNKSEKNPLTGIIKSGHPHRTLGLQIASQVESALAALLPVS